MKLKANKSKHRQFMGVHFEVLATGDKSMITKMNYRKGDKVPIHSHPNEQSGFVISGKHKITIGNLTETLQNGDSYVIPESEDHAWEALESGVVIDVFTPPRNDYS